MVEYDVGGEHDLQREPTEKGHNPWRSHGNRCSRMMLSGWVYALSESRCSGPRLIDYLPLVPVNRS